MCKKKNIDYNRNVTNYLNINCTHTHTHIYSHPCKTFVWLDGNYDQLMQYGLLFINTRSDKFSCTART